MIRQFHIQNYKALRDVTLELTPIHVLIGPNDSGKTSILEAMAAMCRSVDHTLEESFLGGWSGTKLVWNRCGDLPVTLSASIESSERAFEYSFSAMFQPEPARQVRVFEERLRFLSETEPVSFLNTDFCWSRVSMIARKESGATAEVQQAAELVSDALKGVQYYHWDPHLLSLPVASDSNRRFRMEPTGFGLAQCLDDILGDDRRRFSELEARFTKLFPQIESIKLISEPAYRAQTSDMESVSMFSRAEGKGIYFSFRGLSEPVAASQVSDGILLVLAYLTILHLPRPPRLLLVEEPENGIHPARLRDVLSILRQLVEEQSHSQVILTTHSPYVVDLFAPSEVTLCQRQPDGAVTTHRLSESQKVRDQLDVFTLGEIWTAEGDAALADGLQSMKEVVR